MPLESLLKIPVAVLGIVQFDIRCKIIQIRKNVLGSDWTSLIQDDGIFNDAKVIQPKGLRFFF